MRPVPLLPRDVAVFTVTPNTKWSGTFGRPGPSYRSGKAVAGSRRRSLVILWEMNRSLFHLNAERVHEVYCPMWWLQHLCAFPLGSTRTSPFSQSWKDRLLCGSYLCSDGWSLYSASRTHANNFESWRRKQKKAEHPQN